MKTGHKFERDQGEGISERVWREETEERNDAVILQSQQKKNIFKKQPMFYNTQELWWVSHPLKFAHTSLGKLIWKNPKALSILLPNGITLVLGHCYFPLNGGSHCLFLGLRRNGKTHSSIWPQDCLNLPLAITPGVLGRQIFQSIEERRGIRDFLWEE